MLQIDKEIEKVINEIDDLDLKLQNLKEKRIKILSRRKFKFGDGQSFPYNEITLLKFYYTEKGLGYEEDREYFHEYAFLHPNKKIYVRFLSVDSLNKYEIPHETIRRSSYDDGHYVKQIDNYSTHEFTSKFKNVLEITDSNRNGIGDYRFWNY